MHNIVLVIEDNFMASYFLDKCLRVLESRDCRACVIARSQADQRDLGERSRLHESASSSIPGTVALRDLERHYCGFTKTERAMIEMFGVPQYCLADWENIKRSSSVNDDKVFSYIRKTVQSESLWILAFVDEILHNNWMTISTQKVVIGHPGILPHARGLYALEGLARKRDASTFMEGAGATLFFASDLIDCGPVLRSSRLSFPFAFHSLAHLRAAIFGHIFEMFSDLAQELLNEVSFEPIGQEIPQNHQAYIFKRSEATPEKRAAAEAAYQEMRMVVSRSS